MTAARFVPIHTSPEQYGTKTRFHVYRSGLAAGSEESIPLGASIEALYEEEDPRRPLARCAQSLRLKQMPPPSSHTTHAGDEEFAAM